MTKAPTPTEKSKKQRDNIKTPLKTSITQRTLNSNAYILSYAICIEFPCQFLLILSQT